MHVPQLHTPCAPPPLAGWRWAHNFTSAGTAGRALANLLAHSNAALVLGPRQALWKQAAPLSVGPHPMSVALSRTMGAQMFTDGTAIVLDFSTSHGQALPFPIAMRPTMAFAQKARALQDAAEHARGWTGRIASRADQIDQGHVAAFWAPLAPHPKRAIAKRLSATLDLIVKGMLHPFFHHIFSQVTHKPSSIGISLTAGQITGPGTINPPSLNLDHGMAHNLPNDLHHDLQAWLNALVAKMVDGTDPHLPASAFVGQALHTTHHDARMESVVLARSKQAWTTTPTAHNTLAALGHLRALGIPSILPTSS